MKIKAGKNHWTGVVAISLVVSFFTPHVSAAVHHQIQQKPHQRMMQKKHHGPRYSVNMRIGLAGGTPFSVNTLARAGKKTSVTEISYDGETETLVEMTSRKSTVNQQEGLMMDVKVTRRVRGEIKATQKGQIFAVGDHESEARFGVTGRGSEALSLAVLATPI